ncbi:density-regulated protein homolog isoform X2 [Tubulanus polymorphus]
MADDKFVDNKPDPRVRYPLTVLYCGECSMPIEYCEYSANYEECKKWLAENLPAEFEKLSALYDDKATDETEGEKKKRQTRGGKGVNKSKKKVAAPQKICLFRTSRAKKKWTTVITGLSSNEIDIKKASKKFAQKFSCGSSVTGDDEIVIQGYFKDDLWDYVIEEFKIDEDNMDDLGDKSK